MNTLSRAQVEEKIKKLLRDQLSVDAVFVEACHAGTPLLGHGIGLDSIEALALALGIESAFDIQIPDEDLTVELFKTFGSLTDYVTQKIK